jgi:ubiquinone/menaquinone biosynthesis C-methylase UbiE
MENKQKIIEKYRSVAHMPDWLFGFTFPLRRMAVNRLALSPGDCALDLGCGSGASFTSLQAAVGSSGKIMGVDISPEMISSAQARVEKHGWHNVQLVESPAETLALEERFDGLLLFAMHDVLTSEAGLDNVLRFLKPGGRVAAVGPKLASHYPGRILNPLVRTVYKRFSVSQADRGKPWRGLAERVPDFAVEEHGPGILYLFSGTKQ